ncbi:Protein kinase-like domain containing protein [Rhypophila sp. PSN 637]
MNDKTLFHLVPVPGNRAAEEALIHPNNQQFISPSANGAPGLEIGFHVPLFSGGHVITRLGRNADLILSESYSKVHIAFEIHLETFVVMLSIRRKGVSSVKIRLAEHNANVEAQPISGDCALLYGRRYRISIVSYAFDLIWRLTEGSDQVQFLKDMAIQGYEDSRERLKNVRSRDLSNPDTSTARSYYMTRLESRRAPVIKELEGQRESGEYIAVKVVNLRARPGVDVEEARAVLHREIKIMKRVEHDHIISCIWSTDFHTDKPLIFMPLMQGTLHSLVIEGKASDQLCRQVLHEILKALDYLAFENYSHRDVKPLNILYEKIRGQDKLKFQLADFGLANNVRDAKSFCRTDLYRAPELYTFGQQPQTPKMDIWSFFVTMAEILPEYDFPPRNMTFDPSGPMARMDPSLRASAAQMLVAVCGGEGLTTPKNQIPPIEPEVPQPKPQPQPPAISLNVQAPRLAPQPVIEYPQRRGRRPPRYSPSPGIPRDDVRKRRKAKPPPPPESVSGASEMSICQF